MALRKKNHINKCILKYIYLMLHLIWSNNLTYIFKNTHPLNGSLAWVWIPGVPVKLELLAIDT